MSASTARSATAASTAGPPNRRAPRPPGAGRWLREPLLHFVCSAALLFAIDHVLVGRADDPRTIVVGAEVDREASEMFKAARGREPNAEELAALRRVWLDNEVLYREGLALQVDKGDKAIRERVIFKALSVDRQQRQAAAGRRRTCCATGSRSHRDKYDEPARYDFEEAALVRRQLGGRRARVRRGAERRHAGDAKAGLRVFKGRPHANLVQSYGAEFAKALADVQAGRVAGAADARRLAGDAARRDHAAEAGASSRRCAAWCCRTGPTPPRPSSARPPCAR